MPNDPTFIKEWQIAILRIYIKLKPGDVVCSLHLNSEDIIRKKTFTGPDGSIVATVSIRIKTVFTRAVLIFFPNSFAPTVGIRSCAQKEEVHQILAKSVNMYPRNLGLEISHGIYIGEIT